MPVKRGYAPVAFDEAAWGEDLRDTTDAGRAAATQKRAELERDGQPVDELLACEENARDGTSLPECVTGSRLAAPPVSPRSDPSPGASPFVPAR